VEKINIIVINSTGSVRDPGELLLSSGVIKYSSRPEVSHIVAEIAKGKTVMQVNQEIEKPKDAEPSMPRNEQHKKNKRKG
jgi:hypothetical protein